MTDLAARQESATPTPPGATPTPPRTAAPGQPGTTAPGPPGTASPAPAGTAAPATPGPQHPAAPAATRAAGTARPSPVLRRLGAVVSLAGLFFVGFFVYLFGLSGISEQHAQSTMYKTFLYQLSQAVAPVGPTAKEGSPVAILNIPQIGLRDAVVVEGTTSRDLSLGPGHVRASALPGQAGASFIYGKVATFGAPFAHLMQLRAGDRFTVTTGQGVATYAVHSSGTSKYPARDTSLNRLVLMTANSSYIPTAAVQVSADLVSKPQPNPGGWPAITAQEGYLASDSASVIPLLLWSEALLLTAIAGTVAAHRWSRWPAYLITAPVVIAVTWCVYENLAGLLPNLY